MKFIIISNDINIARIASKTINVSGEGVSRIMVDLERIGKQERQSGSGGFISDHEFSDIERMRQNFSGEIIVRINSFYKNSADEIDEAIKSGTDFIMLPYFTTIEEIAKTIDIIDGRVGFIPLFENRKAIDLTAEILGNFNIEEVYLGLHDLSIDMDFNFIFEALRNGIVEDFAKLCNSHNVAFGFGGVGNIAAKPLAGSAILSEHARLGSTRCILSRVFKNHFIEGAKKIDEEKFIEEINKLTGFYKKSLNRNLAEIEKDKFSCHQMIKEIAMSLSN